MTDKPTPTDAELEALLLDKLPASKHYIRPVIEKMVAAMQAAIDKWGQPAQAAEPVARLVIGKTKGGVSLTHMVVPAAYQLQEGVYALYTAPQPVAREPQCWCLTCRPMRFEDPCSIRMALCPTCGNKRCPKANDHRNTCTGSNEPGQPGSAYFGGIKGGQHGTE